jgi:exodeoxyribonuclease VII large subunit
MPVSDLTPSTLAEQLNKALQRQFSDPLWVRATLASFRTNKGGYGNWVVTDDTDSPVKLDVTLNPSVMQRVARQLSASNIALAERLPVRLSVKPSVNRFGKLACELVDLDTEYSAKKTGLTPQQVFEALQQEGLADRQSKLVMEEFPFRLVVVGSDGSDGVRDTLAVLKESGIEFRILPLDVPVQGPAAPAALRAALEAVSSLPTAPDAVLLVRGGGDRGDLVAFDDLELARAVCRFPIPVLCGIGHEADTTVCDLIAHRSERTPTGIATWLTTTVRSGLALRIAEYDLAVSRIAERLDAAMLALEKRNAAIDTATSALDTVAATLDLKLERALSSADAVLQNTSNDLDRRLDLILDRSDVSLTAVAASLDVSQATLRELHPDRALERGFAIVRRDGEVLRSVAFPRPAGVTIELADGSIDATAH